MLAGEVDLKTDREERERETVTSTSIDKEIAQYILYEPPDFNFDSKIIKNKQVG